MLRLARAGHDAELRLGADLVSSRTVCAEASERPGPTLAVLESHIRDLLVQMVPNISTQSNSRTGQRRPAGSASSSIDTISTRTPTWRSSPRHLAGGAGLTGRTTSRPRAVHPL